MAKLPLQCVKIVGGSDMAMSEGSRFGLFLFLGALMILVLSILGLVIFGQLLIIAWNHPFLTILAVILIYYGMKFLWRGL
jgi:hypothetical protein